MTTEELERDHVDRFLEQLAEELPDLDLAVEGIVDRTMGLSRRFRRMMDDTLAGFGLTWGEFKVLSSLRHAGPPHRRSPGRLAEHAELSSGAMTSRLDKLEHAGLVRRLPDPDDRRGIQVELTEKGLQVWQESVGAQARKEALIASALGDDEKQRLNALLRRLMLAFERGEGDGA
jgi:DNA-binding MarR family transcriptional regulator